jgi:hypothetical protein
VRAAEHIDIRLRIHFGESQNAPRPTVEFARAGQDPYDRFMRRALLLILLAGTSVASAQPKQPAKKVPPPKGDMVVVPTRDTLPHREGEYGGVAPGTPQGPKDRPAKPKRPPAKGTLSWIGFEAKDGGAQLFFQSVAPFDVQQHVEGGALVVHLSLSRLGANTWRQVDTRFFDNPLAFVQARQVGSRRGSKTGPARGAGIDVRITFKNPKDAREGSLRAAAADADGMYYAYLAFPEGTDTGTANTTVKEPER